jgi:hypothetical protein
MYANFLERLASFSRLMMIKIRSMSLHVSLRSPDWPTGSCCQPRPKCGNSAARDAPGLLDVSDRFESAGAVLYAAEAAAQTTRVHRDAGRRGSAHAFGGAGLGIGSDVFAPLFSGTSSNEGLKVEVGGIEPPSPGDRSGLLRAQPAVNLASRLPPAEDLSASPGAVSGRGPRAEPTP